MIVEKRLQFVEAYQHHGYRLSDIANTQTAGANSSVRGDTSFVVENDMINFDDFTKDEESGHYWACICKECASKYGISETLLDEAGQGTCSVQGCQNEADYYIDFPELEEPKKGIWQIAADFLRGVVRCIRYRIRRLMPIECERLDGFPDDWTRYGQNGVEFSDTVRYKALGNSIAVPCADRVFAGIMAVERERTGEDS